MELLNNHIERASTTPKSLNGRKMIYGNCTASYLSISSVRPCDRLIDLLIACSFSVTSGHFLQSMAFRSKVKRFNVNAILCATYAYWGGCGWVSQNALVYLAHSFYQPTNQSVSRTRKSFTRLELTSKRFLQLPGRSFITLRVGELGEWIL